MADPDAAADPIEAVAARMEAIAEPLPEDDGVARFNELYLAVTRAVMAETRADSYEDPAFISRLDVIFADLYFDAIEADTGGRDLPKAWGAAVREAPRARRGPVAVRDRGHERPHQPRPRGRAGQDVRRA